MSVTKTKGENTMKTKFYLDGKKTTRKAVKELVGEERLKRMLKEAKETFLEDPMVQNDFFIGSGMLTIEFRKTIQAGRGKGLDNRPVACTCLWE